MEGGKEGREGQGIGERNGERGSGWGKGDELAGEREERNGRQGLLLDRVLWNNRRLMSSRAIYGQVAADNYRHAGTSGPEGVDATGSFCHVPGVGVGWRAIC